MKSFFDKEMIRLILSTVAIPILVGLYAIITGNIAEKRNDLDAMTKLIPFLSTKGPQAEIAIEMIKTLSADRHNDIVDEVVSRNHATDILDAGVAGALKSPDPLVQAEALSIIKAESIVSDNVELSETIQYPVLPTENAASNIGNPPQLVYIQVYGLNGMESALSLQSQLIEDGSKVPAIENVGNELSDLKYAQRSTIGIRYYYDSDKAAANYTASVVKNTLHSSADVEVQALLNRAQKASKGTIEVWYPCTLETNICDK